MGDSKTTDLKFKEPLPEGDPIGALEERVRRLEICVYGLLRKLDEAKPALTTSGDGT